MKMINNQVQEIDEVSFRTGLTKELNEKSKFLAGWLESKDWLDNKNIPRDSRRPFTRKGREFIDFYDTLYHVLFWYQQFKSGTFNKKLGWHIDTDVVKKIEKQFREIIRHVLAFKNKHQFDDFFKSYDVYNISYYTAIDYKFQNLTGSKMNNILDFGSGVGRQSFSWCLRDDVNFFSIDAIESLYVLQNKIYSLLFPDRLCEYLYDPKVFCTRDFNSSVNKLYHLPTWKTELLPSDFFDLIICVQVLHEINEETLRYMLSQFKRIIKKGGFLYIRDNEFWSPSHKVRVGRELLKQGWQLIFRYPGSDGIDIAGVPRLWVFTGEDNSNYFKYTRRLKRIFLPSYPGSFHTWKDFGLPI